MMRCRRCGRRVWGWPWDLPFCSGERFDSCLNIYESMFDPPPVVREEPDPVPDDLHVCPTCSGTKSVFERQDFETGARHYMPCPICAGTGVVSLG